MSSLFLFDQTVKSEGFASVCGVDEVGRGPMAGDVYAAAVILNPGFENELINDSKKLSQKKREMLAEIIKANSRWSVASASVEEIDRLNILQAALLAMRRAVKKLPELPDIILIDGDKLPEGLPCVARTVVRGDSTSASIAAASIIAKVERDEYMENLVKQYPEYDWTSNKGYGTPAHQALIEQYGACPAHRRSFLKKLEAKLGRSL